MSDVSLLRFLNSSDAFIQSDILALIHELDLEESQPFYIRALGSEQSRRQSFGSFEADRALQARYNTPVFRPHYKPDLSAFEPFYQQLELFPL